MIAVFSDVHGNAHALEAVLNDARSAGARDFYSLGDVVGYGAHPARCVELVEETASVKVFGNHDAAVLNPAVARQFRAHARTAVDWTRDALSERDLERLEAYEFVTCRHGARLVHASPVRPEDWTYILRSRDAEQAMRAVAEDICFVGHTHTAEAYVVRDGIAERTCDASVAPPDGGSLLVNVGSVGQPRDGDPRASYALFDSRARTVSFRRVEYDHASAARDILAAGLPHRLADRLESGR